MPRLILHPGSPGAGVFQLKPGVNTIGRATANDFSIPDLSVSGTHCEIQVSDAAVRIRDLGSTNGTFVNQVRIREAALLDGEYLRLGEVEMVFYMGAEPGAPSAAIPSGAVTTAPTASPGAPRPRLARTETMATAVPAPHATAHFVPATAAMPSVALPPPPGSGPRVIGPQFCRFHPKSPARFFCAQCQHYFCDACVALRKVGGTQGKFCRHCGRECEPVEVHMEAAPELGFLGRLPGGFLYPLRGGGIFIIAVGIIVYAAIELGLVLWRYGTLRTILMGSLLIICAGGYLFTYLQTILHSTSAEDKELPDLPGISSFAEDVVAPFFRVMALLLLCFSPALASAVWYHQCHEPTAVVAFYIAGAFGYLYFPMAFLALAILDSLAAANPMVVVSSILRVPGEYFLALVSIVLAFSVDKFGKLGLDYAFPEGWLTKSVGVLLAMIAAQIFLAFLTMYLLLVAVHILGLVFAARKEALGWMRD